MYNSTSVIKTSLLTALILISNVNTTVIQLLPVTSNLETKPSALTTDEAVLR